MAAASDNNPSTFPAPPRRANTVLSGWLRDVIISLVVSAFFIIFLYQPVKVEGTSMMPTLQDQERVFINKFVYKLEPIARGDVIVFRYPRDPAKSYIKRVIAVADAMGVPGAGIFGDILCARLKKRNVAALVTDGAVRDRAGVLMSALPVWCGGVAAPASVNGLTFVGWQEPIGCGGCAIFPGDVIVADDDGAVVIPQAMLEVVAQQGAEHELYESWVFSEVENGVKLPGLYPLDDDAKARYAAWRKSRS